MHLIKRHQECGVPPHVSGISIKGVKAPQTIPNHAQIVQHLRSSFTPLTLKGFACQRASTGITKKKKKKQREEFSAKRR